MSQQTTSANELCPKRQRDHADAVYEITCGVDHKGVEFIGNKITDTQLFI